MGEVVVNCFKKIHCFKEAQPIGFLRFAAEERTKAYEKQVHNGPQNLPLG